MPVVSCPECQRKLKVAPTSVGKSVRCVCGKVFKAEEADEPADAHRTPMPAPAAATLVVACDGCQAKLKVPASARGRKMKCSKCGTTFVVPQDDAPPPPPARTKPAPPPRALPPSYEEVAEDDAPPARKTSPSRPPFFEDVPEDEPRPTRKSASSTPAFREDAEGNIEMADPQARAHGKGKAASRATEEAAAAPRKQPAPASGCTGCVLSIFVRFIVLGYSAALAALHYYPETVSEYVTLPFERPPAEVGKFHNIPHAPDADSKENNKDADGDKKVVDPGEDKDKKDAEKDKDKKDTNSDAAEKKNDKDSKGDDADKAKKRGGDNKDAVNEGEGATQMHATPMAITPANQPAIGRPAKPAWNDRKNHRAASA
jgi:predicted Zn finger-like uncharacterized protein